MKNWNTDTSSFKNKSDRRIWELSQLINYGLNGKKISEKEIKINWIKLKPKLDFDRARMLKYLIWGTLSLPKTNKKFWGLSPKISS